MQTEQLIQVDTFCRFHNIEFSFISSLHEFGLIEITQKEEKSFIAEGNLELVERLIRLHNDLHINVEGVEVITYLLDQIKLQQDEITRLQNRLRFYEWD
jgi:chaperone modulatory protein CbpM